MAAMWTHGTWTVRPGREEDFIRTWTDMARRGMAELEPAAPPTLLHDTERPNVFISFGPWRSREDLERFRSSAILRGALESLQPDILEAFEPRVLDEVEQDG